MGLREALERNREALESSRTGAPATRSFTQNVLPRQSTPEPTPWPTRDKDEDRDRPTYSQLLERQKVVEKEIEENQPRNTSIWNQVKEVAASAGPGVLDFALAVAEEPGNWAKAFPDMITGNSNADTSGNWWQDIQGGFREYSPVIADFATSTTGTAGRLDSLANPGRYLYSGIRNKGDFTHDANKAFDFYKTASDEGRIVQAFTEDAGNVAFIGGGLGAAAGRISKPLAAGAADARLVNTAVGFGKSNRPVIPGRSPLTRPVIGETANPPISGWWNTPVDIGQPKTLRTTRVGKPLSIAESKIVKPVAVINKRGTGLAGMLERKALLERGSKNQITNFVGNADGTGSYSYGSGKTFNSQNVRLRDTPNQRLLKTAENVSKFGQGARRVSLSADWLDPSTPIITGAAKVLQGAPRTFGRITRPIGRVLAGTAVGQNVLASNASRRRASEARSTVLDTSVVEGQREGIAAQYYLDTELKNAGVSDRAQRDMYGGVVLNVLDRGRQDLLKGYFNEGYFDGTLPKSARNQVLFEYNELIKNPELRVTKEMLEIYARYEIPKIASKAGLERLPSNIRKLIDETIAKTEKQIDRRTVAMRESDKIIDEQLQRPTVTVRLAPDGRFLEELDIEERSKLRDSDIVEQTIERDGVPQKVLRAAKADGRLHTPYLETVTSKMRERMANEKLDLETKLEPATASRLKLESELGVSTALRDSMPGPGKDVPFSDSAVARYGSLEKASKAYADLQAELFELETLQGELLDPTDPFAQQARAQVDARIDTIYKQMAEDRNFGTRVELDAIADNQPRISELLKLKKKELYAQAKAAGIRGRSTMNRVSLAEALAPTKAADIRADTDAKVAAGKESIAQIEADAAAPGINHKRISEALAEQAQVVEDTFQATRTGTNFTPEGIWEGDDMGYNPEPRRPDAAAGDPETYFNLTERPEGTFSEGALDPTEEFGSSKLGDVDPETISPNDVVAESLSLSDAARPVNLPSDISAAAGATDAPPIPGTERATSDAIKSIEQNAVLKEKLSIAAREEWIIQQQIAAVERRSQNLERSLGSTQQDSLRRVGREGVNAMADAIETANTSGASVGEWIPNDNGPGGRLTGLLAKITSKYGGDLVKMVEKKAEAMTNEIRRQQRIHGEIYDQMTPEKKLALRYEEDIWNKEQFIKSEMPDAQIGRINIGAMAFEDTLRELSFLGKTFEDVAFDSDTYYAALAADEVSQYVRAIGDSKGLMSGFDAFQAWGTALAHMDPKLKKFMSEDVKLAVDTAMKDYRDKWNRQMLRMNDEYSAATPAIWRTPIINARRQVASTLKTAEAYWEKGDPESRDVAAALELTVRDSPTSFAAYAVDGTLLTPQHIIGGAVNGRTGPYRSTSDSIRIVEAVEAPGTKSENRRKSGNRVNTLREYALIEAREMTNLALDNGVRRIAADPTYSSSMLDIIKDRVVQYLSEGQGRDITFGQMEEWLGEAGYTIIKNTTEDATSRPVTRFGDIGPQQSVMDEAGTPRTYAYDGTGLNLELDAIPDITERTWRNGFAEFPDVRVMDKKMAAQVGQFQRPLSGPYLTAFDQTTQLWKTATLAWSAAWVTYNAIGNALMATFSAGMSPYQIAYNLEQLRQAGSAANKADGGTGKWTIAKGLTGIADPTSSLVPARLGTHGLSWTERQSTMMLGSTDTRLGRAVDYFANSDRSWWGSVTERMYALNEFTDNMFRSAVYLDQLQKRLPEIPKDLLNPNGTLRDNLNPTEQTQLTDIGTKAQEASDLAVKASLNTMGDFTRLTPFERDYVKRAMPFYPWLRHQTAMIYRIPMSNPLRFAFMASLDNIIGQDEDPTFLESLLSGFAMTGPASGIALRSASPFKFGGLTAFSDSGESGNGVGYSPENVFSAVNPLGKLPLTLGFGISSSGGDISRPVNDKNISGSGAQGKNSAVTNFIDNFGDFGGMKRAVGEGIYQTLGNVPQTRGIRDMVLSSPALGGDQKPRYGDGQVIQHADNRQQNSIAQQLGRTLRIPFIPTDVTRLMEVAEDRDYVREAEFYEAQRKAPTISNSVRPSRQGRSLSDILNN
tara:strand:+ start:3037 stop:9210 length:6174 start_codon:yes stop_codon:yes gene_type:complete